MVHTIARRRRRRHAWPILLSAFLAVVIPLLLWVTIAKMVGDFSRISPLVGDQSPIDTHCGSAPELYVCSWSFYRSSWVGWSLLHSVCLGESGFCSRAVTL